MRTRTCVVHNDGDDDRRKEARRVGWPLDLGRVWSSSARFLPHCSPIPFAREPVTRHCSRRHLRQIIYIEECLEQRDIFGDSVLLAPASGLTTATAAADTPYIRHDMRKRYMNSSRNFRNSVVYRFSFFFFCDFARQE